jgi:hypothetical protein
LLFLKVPLQPVPVLTAAVPCPAVHAAVPEPADFIKQESRNKTQETRLKI